MDHLARLVSRRRWLVLGIWIVLLVAALPFASKQTEELTAGGFEVPGSGSVLVQDALERFPEVQAEELIFVFDNRAGDTAALDDAIQRAAGSVEGVEGVSLPAAAVAAARGASGDDIVLMPLKVDGGQDTTVDAAVDMREELGLHTQGDVAVPVHLVGTQALWAALQDVSKEDLEHAEVIGFPIVLIILLAVFGSFAAAVLPLGLGIASVILTGASIFFLSQTLDMSVFVTNIASMLGIGVAIDYSLFVLARYREELAGGADEDEARRRAMRTSGLAVAFSGGTVIIALAGLFLVDSTVLHSMAIGAIVVVAISVIGAVTLLPALIQVFGKRVYQRGKVVGWVGTQLSRLKPKRAADPDRKPFWDRWTAALMRRPALYATLATVVMLAIAIPALSLHLDTAAVGQLPEDNEARAGFEQAASVVGPGATAPIQVLAEFRGGGDGEAAANAFADTVREVPGVEDVRSVTIARDGDAALIEVVPTTGPEDDATTALVEQLRAPDGPASALREDATVSIGGATAQAVDTANQITDSLWKVILFVIVCSYVILLIMLRSVVLPLKAVLMNLLTVAAAYGVLVMVFQYGWFDGILGFDHLGFVNSITPALLLAVVFGLSMDYEVFLLSRIRERYGVTQDNEKAVAQGLAASAKTISSAALIMVAVFMIFAFTGLPQVKEIGIGLAVAIFLDATVVRLILVPTTMQLMGDWNWWIPSWLDRILPHADFESAGVEEEEPATVA